jgi:multiple sugar transport system permease protein/raffinose/stachyose/melibiose transport system permease protein
LAFTVVPVFMTFFNSFHILRMDLGMKQQFVGIRHYFEILTDDDIFSLAVRNSLIWAFVSPLLEIPFAFLLAFILYTKVPLTRLFRVTWFSPILVSWVVVGVIFRWVYNYDWGILNVILRAVRLESLALNWLGRPDTALPALIAVTTWKFVGFNMVILLAALSSIPEEFIDAARIDGAGRVRLVRHIIIPLLQPTIVNLLILCFIGKMKQMELVWVTTRGGPMHFSETVATYVQKRAFDWRTLDLGYPSAIAVLWFIVIFSLTLIFTRILQRREVLEF